MTEAPRSDTDFSRDDVWKDPGHGDSPAAWTGVIIMLIGVTVGTTFFILDMPVLVWVSVGIVVAGLVVGWIMRKAGLGVDRTKLYAKEH